MFVEVKFLKCETETERKWISFSSEVTLSIVIIKISSMAKNF